jgi:hypothetical protein
LLDIEVPCASAAETRLLCIAVLLSAIPDFRMSALWKTEQGSFENIRAQKGNQQGMDVFSLMLA